MACTSSSTTPAAVVLPPLVRSPSNILLCPQRRTLLVDAVVLFPCGHSVSAAAAKCLSKIEGFSQNPLCPECRKPVQGTCPNHLARSLVKMAVAGTFGEVAPRPRASINVEGVQFPGIEAKFTVTSETKQQEVIWTFTSQTKGSLFEKVIMSEKGNVIVTFPGHCGEVKAYLSSCGINISDEQSKTGRYTANTKERSLLLKILLAHNEFPRDKEGVLQTLSGW